MSTNSIPSQFVNLLREVLVGQARRVRRGDQSLSAAATRTPASTRTSWRPSTSIRALLDQVGSVRTVPAVQVEVDSQPGAPRGTDDGAPRAPGVRAVHDESGQRHS